MVGWSHRLDGHGFERIWGGCEGQGGLACCTPWGHKEWHMTEQPNNNNYKPGEAIEVIIRVADQSWEVLLSKGNMWAILFFACISTFP